MDVRLQAFLLVISLANAVLSFPVAILSINETVIHIFIVINPICAVLAQILGLMKRKLAASILAASPIPLGILTVFALAIFDHMQNGERHWEEVVHLSSGSDIVVKRAFSSSGLMSGAPIENDIEVDLPRVGHVKWGETLTPLAFDEDDKGNVYVVTVVTMFNDHKRYSIPENVSHVAFKYNGSDGHGWVRIPLEQVPQNIVPNLLISTQELFIKRHYDASKQVDLVVKQDIDSDPRIDRSFRTWIPSPPLSVPLDITTAGNTASIGVSIAYSHANVYPFSMQLQPIERNQSDLEIPVQLEISSSNGVVLVTQAVVIKSENGVTENAVNRYIGRIRLEPGEYQVSVRNINDHPEAKPMKITIGAGTDNEERKDQQRWGPGGQGAYVSPYMKRLLDHIHDTDLLNHLSNLKRLPDDFSINTDAHDYKKGYFYISMPAGMWNACSYGINLDAKSNQFWVTEICGEGTRPIYQGELAF